MMCFVLQKLQNPNWLNKLFETPIATTQNSEEVTPKVDDTPSVLGHPTAFSMTLEVQFLTCVWKKYFIEHVLPLFIDHLIW